MFWRSRSFLGTSSSCSDRRCDARLCRFRQISLKELHASGREQLQFLRVAWSSLIEVGYYIHVAERLGYIGQPLRREIESHIRQVAAPLLGLIKHRQQKSPRRLS